MPLKIVRNDITKMNTEAIVNTANDYPTVGTGCDYAIYKAAGYDDLLKYRTDKIGFVPEGDAFITPGFNLGCKYIIHAVSPLYIDGESGEEEKLRSCYSKCLALAKENDVKSISFPLIATGGFGYPREEGFCIAVDEISSFLVKNEMTVYLVVFGQKSKKIASSLFADLESYVDQKYVNDRNQEEYFGRTEFCEHLVSTSSDSEVMRREKAKLANRCRLLEEQSESEKTERLSSDEIEKMSFETYEKGLKERMNYTSDTFSEYLLRLIDSKGMSYPEVYKNSLVEKKLFSKIKTTPDYHPKKITAMCLCIGAQLNIDQTKRLLAKAGYALSSSDKTDIIFSYFIEKGYYNMIDLDIKLEEYNLPCLIP